MDSASAIIATLSCVSCTINERRDLHKGNDLYDSGNYFEARLSYRTAIQRNPKLGEAYYKLGLTEQKLHDSQAAFQALNQAALLLPAREDIKAALGDLCLAALSSDPALPRNLYDTAVAISEEFLAKDQTSFRGLSIKGNLALLNHRPSEAVSYFQRAHRQRANDPTVAVGLLNSLILSGQDGEAEQAAMRYIGLHKTDGAVYDFLYAHYFDRHRHTEAEQILKLKISNNPREPAYVGELGMFYWRLGRQTEALDLIAGTLTKSTRPPAAHLVAGDFYAAIGRLEEANQQFEEGMRSARDQEVVFQKRLLSLALTQGNNAQAASLADHILSVHPLDDEALKTRANLRVESGQPLALAGAVEDYKILLRGNGRDATIHYGFGRALKRKGDVVSARVEFHEAVNLKPGYPEAEIALAEIAIEQHKPQEALQWTTRVLSGESKNTQARLLKALALLTAGELSQGRAELEQLIQMAPDEKSAYLQFGLLEIQERNFQKAVTAFEKLLRLGEGDPRAPLALYSAPGQFDQAYALLKKELEHNPNHPLVHELLAGIDIQAHQYDHALSEYHALLIINPGSLSIHLGLAEVFKLKGDWNNYTSSLERAQKLFPGDGSLATQLASALKSAGRQREAIQQYRRALELRPDTPTLLNSLASVILETNGNLDEAMRLAQRAVDKSPGEPAFLDTLGWIYFKKNMTDRALQLFTRLVKQYPNDPTFRYHLGAALLRKGDRQGAREVLQLAQAIKTSKENTEKIRELLAQLP